MKKALFALLSVALFFASCKKDDNTTDALVPDGSVLILNQGQFTHGNATVTLYNPVTDSTTQNLFQSVNSRPLGDVAQSMMVSNGKGYIVVNNSSKIEVVDMNSFQSAGTITGVVSPRYILPVGNNKAYVSDLYSGLIYIVDLSSNAVVDSIVLAGETEQMELINNKVYALNIHNSDSTWVVEIDPGNKAITNSTFLTLHSGAGMVKGSDNQLWVMCTPFIDSTQFPGLVKVDPSTHAVTQTLTYSSSQYDFSSLTVSTDGNSIYFLNDGLFKMDINATTLPSSPYISDSHYTYGLGIDKNNEKAYLAAPIDYIQNGKVYVYNLNTKALVDSISTGVVPGFFVFK